MKVVLGSNEEAMKVIKRMIFLAYEACGGPVGMGLLQAVDKADEERVWKNAFGAEDYCMKHTGDTEVYGDYVFGRMMKWGCSWKDNIIMIPDRKFCYGYQGFSGVYKDNKALLTATLKSLNI